MTVEDAIANAERILPGVPARHGKEALLTKVLYILVEYLERH